ncbi:MAG: DNA ligase [Rhizobacter sp.]|nr:DNA ligase [Rhizobacter sp.]
MPTTLATRRTLIAALAALPWLPRPAHAGARALMLAEVYREGVPLADYWVSEKYDGVRAYWDGQTLWTRHGHRIAAPAWFTAGWPAEPLDGELWAGRGRFTQASSAANRDVAADDDWRAIHYMVFDLPAQPGTFDARLAALGRLFAMPQAAWLKPVAQHKLDHHAALMARLRDTVRAGGEGLVLHRGDSLYRGERNDDLLKLKEHVDAEATVVGYVPGRGKYEGLTGALLVQTPQGQRFRLGSGLSDQARRSPPPLGTTVTYRYAGLHPNGLPRFASFLRVRSE